MKIHKDCKIELASSNDKQREALQHPYFDGESVVATDGRILAVVPVESEDSPKDRPGYLPCGVLKEARMASRSESHCRIGLNGKIVFPTRQGACSIPRIKGLRFPNWQNVVPKPDSRKSHVVRLNPKLLWQLCQACGGDEEIDIDVDLNDANAPVKVSSSKTKAWGILMPMRQR